MLHGSRHCLQIQVMTRVIHISLQQWCFVTYLVIPKPFENKTDPEPKLLSFECRFGS